MTPTNSRGFLREFIDLAVALIFQRKLIISGHHLLNYLFCRLTSILWDFFGCICHIAHQTWTFPLMVIFFMFSLSNGADHSALLFRGSLASVWLYWCYFGAVIYAIHYLHLIIDSGLLFSVDWIDFVNLDFRIQKKTRLESHFERPLTSRDMHYLQYLRVFLWNSHIFSIFRTTLRNMVPSNLLFKTVVYLITTKPHKFSLKSG